MGIRRALWRRAAWAIGQWKAIIGPAEIERKARRAARIRLGMTGGRQPTGEDRDRYNC
ncbi:MAG: hypothetical protein JWL96_221 [Sphingomonas bacterium]|nr:hypothetical protein [Sphingomonas bacterium]